MTEVNEIKTDRRRFYVKAVLFMLIPAVLARIFHLVYSNCATNIAVPDAVTQTVSYCAIAFTCIMYGAMCASITGAVYRFSPACGIVVLLAYAGIFFADCLFRFTSDYLGGMLEYRMIWAIIDLLTAFFIQVAIAMCVWMLSVAFHHLNRINGDKNKYSLKTALAVTLGFDFAVPFVNRLVAVFSFLNEVEWIPTSSELQNIFKDLAEVAVFYGVLVFAAGYMFLWLFKIKQEKK